MALLIDVKEAARRLSLSRAQFYKLMAEGKVDSVKIGGSRRILVSDLNTFVDEVKAKQTTSSNGDGA